MKLAAINKALTSALTQLKNDGLKVQFKILRAAGDDLTAERDAFHLGNLLELSEEIRTAPEYATSEKTLAKLKDLSAACRAAQG